MIKVGYKPIEFKSYPNGETYFNLSVSDIKQDYFVSTFKIIEIEFKYINDSSLMRLFLVKKHIDSLKLECKINLRILYMPYSRQDRRGDNALSVFTLKYVCDFINSMNFNRVSVIEPHSDVCTALLNDCKDLNVVDFLFSVSQNENTIDFVKDRDYILFPDAGAQKRYNKIFQDYKVIVGSKERDSETGYITHVDIHGLPEGSKDFNVVIIDDLCSKGGTFIMAGEQLKLLGANEIYLIVAHCENSIIDGSIIDTDVITKVVTTDSLLNKQILDDIPAAYRYKIKVVSTNIACRI